MTRRRTVLERTFDAQIQQAGLPEPTPELRFHDTRRWRFDDAWPDFMLAVEIEGGTRGKSRHTSGDGFESDCEKYNAAALAGWRVLRYTADSVNDWSAAKQVKGALG